MENALTGTETDDHTVIEASFHVFDVVADGLARDEFKPDNKMGSMVNLSGDGETGAAGMLTLPNRHPHEHERFCDL